MKKFKIGIQLYTLRDVLGADFQGTLKALKTMGFDGVEFAWNYGGMSPAELAAFLKEIGLVACGIHIGADQLTNPDGDVYKYAKALNCHYVTTSLAEMFPERVEDAVELCAQIGKAAAAQGVTFTYHNHARELASLNEEIALSTFYARTEAGEVMAELDTYWLKKGKADPVEWVRKYASRLPQLHCKDMNPGDEKFTEIGRGCIDFPKIIAAASEGITEWLIYEQDICPGNQLESARSSINYLKKILG